MTQDLAFAQCALAWTLLGIGLCGTLGMMAACVLVAPVLTLLRPATRPDGSRGDAPAAALSEGLDVLIPAHNEEKILAATLESVERALARFARSHPSFRARIRVGADACTDKTVEIARDRGATVLELPENRSKWKTLGDLLKMAPQGTTPVAPWIAFADAGAIWPETLLLDLEAARIRRSSRSPDAVVAVLAPSYRPKGGGALEHAHWSMERFLKSVECRLAGGPVSVHGATVLYLRKAALRAYEKLEATSHGRSWLNDDVVLPLAIRLELPGARIEYVPGSAVSDEGLCQDIGLAEARRRRRMARGNAQWIRSLVPTVFAPNALAMDPRIALVVLRRVFRWVWAWWALLIAMAALLFANAHWGVPWTAIAGTSFALAIFAWMAAPRPLSAALASLAAPVELFRGSNGEWS